MKYFLPRELIQSLSGATSHGYSVDELAGMEQQVSLLI
jgi:hypothetical protein